MVGDVHKGYSGVLEFQILIWKGLLPPLPDLGWPLEYVPDFGADPKIITTKI